MSLYWDLHISFYSIKQCPWLWVLYKSCAWASTNVFISFPTSSSTRKLYLHDFSQYALNPSTKRKDSKEQTKRKMTKRCYGLSVPPRSSCVGSLVLRVVGVLRWCGILRDMTSWEGILSLKTLPRGGRTGEGGSETANLAPPGLPFLPPVLPGALSLLHKPASCGRHLPRCDTVKGSSTQAEWM